MASRGWKQRTGYKSVEPDPEKARARSRGWRHANRDHVAAYRRRIYAERQRDTNTAAVADYRQRNPGKHAEIENRRRARLLDQFVAPVDFDEVWCRAKGCCGICGERVARKEASLDHIIPIARGGTHEPRNVQLAHRVCNSRKGATY